MSSVVFFMWRLTPQQGPTSPVKSHWQMKCVMSGVKKKKYDGRPRKQRVALKASLDVWAPLPVTSVSLWPADIWPQSNKKLSNEQAVTPSWTVRSQRSSSTVCSVWVCVCVCGEQRYCSWTAAEMLRAQGAWLWDREGTQEVVHKNSRGRQTTAR